MAGETLSRLLGTESAPTAFSAMTSVQRDTDERPPCTAKAKICLDGCSPKTKPWHPVLPSTGAEHLPPEEDGQGWVSKAGSWEEEGLAFAPVLGSECAPSQQDEGHRGCPGKIPLGEGWITKHFAGSAARVSCFEQDKQHKASSPISHPAHGC